MDAKKDAISVRTTRLNNVLLGCGRCYGVSAALSESITRESLLDAFCLLYNECDKVGVRKRDKNIAEFVNKYRSIVEETRCLRVNADDFIVRTQIGKGYFGNVHLVIEKQTGDIYAMKKIKKSNVTNSQVKEERIIMSKRCSEWITNLQYAFQDKDNLFLIMEYMPGGDLLNLMTRHGPFDEDLTRFYLAELTLAINTLHKLGYVHRDIKPENILIDRFGHIKLADFGNAAALDKDGHVFSLSPVGTPDYIAPELLQTLSSNKLTKNMHDMSCDYWSMGIIGYEMVCETTPFHEDNVHETYSKILSHREGSRLKEILSFPTELKISADFKNLIESLVTNPSKRIKYEGMRSHKFFERIKWENLRSEVPPIIPTLQSDDDTSNFDDIQRKKVKKVGAGGGMGATPSKSLTTTMSSNDFCGKNLPFIGYSFVHMDTQNEHGAIAEDERYAKLNTKHKELLVKHKERLEEITGLKQELIRAELATKQSNTQSKILHDAKEEIAKMKTIVKDKNAELANFRTQIKTLQSSLKIEQEMWEKKESTITELLRMNRQKYEDAKLATEMRYEKRIGEKKTEINSINKKLDEREVELNAKTEECMRLQEKVENYKEILKQHKDQAQKDREDFEKNKMQLTETYEQKLVELRTKLRYEKDHKSRLTMELRDVRTELDDTVICNRSSEEVKQASAKSNEEILKRLNREIEANNELHKSNVDLEQKLTEMQKSIDTMQQEMQRLERELQLAECGKNFAESNLADHSSPYETAPGSLSDVRAMEEQLRADLEVAKENEHSQKARADKLQDIVEKLEQMLERFNEQSLSPTKPMPAPRACTTASNTTPTKNTDDLLEKQNEKLEDKLVAVRELMIVERQSARTANLALWKAEKKLEDVLAEKKMVQRRMELTEDRIKKVQNERDDAQRMYKSAEEAKKEREHRIEELKQEILSLKGDILKEHHMWEKAEKERMKCKSEIIEHISTVKKLENNLIELQQKLQKSQQKCDKLDVENKRLFADINREKDSHSATSDQVSALQMQMKNLKDNYERLKYACTITDNQLTEVEVMLDKEQKCNKAQHKKLDEMHAADRKRDETETELKRLLREEQTQKQAFESRTRAMTVELEDLRSSLEQLQKKLASQQQHLMEQTSALFSTQEKVEVLENENQNVQTINENYERELGLLKEENARILSNLFHAKEEAQILQQNLKDAMSQVDELKGELLDVRHVLEEKENFYLQRDIKSEATLAQHKKLIDYLQLKVEDLSQKRKKTFADKLFGGSASKENVAPTNIESSILYRTLQEELKREKLKSKSLQEQLDKLEEKQTSTLLKKSSELRSPLKSIDNHNSNDAAANRNTLPKSKENGQHKSDGNRDCTVALAKHLQSHHRFELALQETNAGSEMCVACKNPIVANSPYWKCRECKQVTHRKCRGDVKEACDGVAAVISNVACETGHECVEDTTAPSADTESVGKYSYEGQYSANDEANQDNTLKPYNGTLIYSVDQNHPQYSTLEISCAYEIEENKILLLGCNTGLFAYHIKEEQLVHIAGIDAVSCIATSKSLAKAIMVGSRGESLYQCDLRHLQSRCQTNACLRPAVLEASVLELPLSHRDSTEKWQLVQISQENEQPLDTVAVGATSARIIIMKYDVKQQKFKPVRALDTATSVNSIVFTRHTAIVSSDKFFEIDLSSYGAEEFVDVADQTLSHTRTCQPVVAIRISKQEFVLCFMECGVFVDEYGCRSRPYDINWEYTPCGFLYRAPFLFVAHFQSLQVIRLHRSYSQELAASKSQKDADADVDASPQFQRMYLPFYMPSILTESGEHNAYALAVQKNTGLQEIYHTDALRLFKDQHSQSLETISSVATSLTLGSMANIAD